MCGIAGVAGFGLTPFDGEFALDSCAAMHHRGPDESTEYRDEHIAFAIARLRVVGLVGGSQPSRSDNGEVVSVVNGEIYNHRALRTLLAQRGRSVSGASDANIVPALYQEFGADFVKHLHGMFAIALYDRRQRKLLLITDRVGKKPLYFTQVNGGSIAFASELNGLLRYPGIRRDVDPVAVDQFLSYRIIGAPRTIYRDVARVQPATILEFNAQGRRTEQRYWSFPFTAEIDSPGSINIDEIDRLLHQAVESRLESEVPLGSMLSGGLDSSLVVALAAQKLGQRIHTFSVGFDHPSFDESAHAAMVSEHCDTEHHLRVITPDYAAASADRILQHMGEPFAFPSAIASDAMYQLAREHVTVVLTGDGSDEIFCGYNRYRRLLDSIAASGSDDLPASYERILADGVPRAVKQRLYTREHTDSIPGFPVDHLRERFARTDPRAGAVDRAMHVDSGFWLADAQLVKIDRMSMAHSVEPRSPFLDHRLIEFTARVAASQKMIGGEEKVLLKQVASRYLPDSIVYRRKQELAVPLEGWLSVELRDTIQNSLLSENSLDRGYFDPDALRRFATEFRPEDSYALWTLHMLERWHQLHIDQSPHPELELSH